jgi:hypothetical protein
MSTLTVREKGLHFHEGRTRQKVRRYQHGGVQKSFLERAKMFVAPTNNKIYFTLCIASHLLPSSVHAFIAK